MTLRLWALACFAPVLAWAGSRERAVLVVKHPEQVTPAHVEAARRASGLDLLTDAQTRQVLERSASTAEAEARAELMRAHQGMRQFELGKVEQALERARASLEHAAYSEERRDLELEIALRGAELCLLTKDEAALARELGTALSLSPRLMLDPDRYAPRLVSELARVRAQREHAPRLTMKIESVPAGASVWSAGQRRCCAPLELDVAPGPLLLWLELSEHRPQVRREMAQRSEAMGVELSPLTSTDRLELSVRGLRAAGADTEPSEARRLGDLLGTDAVAVLDEPLLPPRLYPLHPSDPTKRGAGVSLPRRTWAQRHWPSLLAGGVAVGLAVAGAVLGTRAEAAERRALASPFASTGATQAAEADKEGTAANYCFGAAGGAALVGGGLYFVF